MMPARDLKLVIAIEGKIARQNRSEMIESCEYHSLQTFTAEELSL